MFKGPRFVRALEAAGHRVTVVTGFPNYPDGKLHPGYRMRPVLRETLDGARVVRLPLYPSHDASSLRRALNFVSFFVSALLYCLFRRQRFDIAYVYQPPVTVGLAAALAGLVRPLPYMLDIQDLWPDSVAATGMRGARALAWLLRPVCRFVHARAAAILVQSEGMRRTLIARGIAPDRIVTILNWADADSPPDPARNTARDIFTMVYGGNLGRAQALSTVVEAAAIVERQRRDIRLHLYGDGIDAARLAEQADELSVTILDFPGRVSRAEIARRSAAADALLLHLADDPLFAITIPTKTQAYLAYGRPIVAGIAGEAAGLLERSGAALVVPPQDASALAAAICRLADLPAAERAAMGRRGRQFYETHLAFDRAIARTLSAIAGTYRRSCS
ncbi:MAG TPA: glycosyltransferase family 4 protein [Sphingomonas sp.]|nr:glycosyltransferase family 4 protein [Sphingomonas sp.]